MNPALNLLASAELRNDSHQTTADVCLEHGRVTAENQSNPYDTASISKVRTLLVSSFPRLGRASKGDECLPDHLPDNFLHQTGSNLSLRPQRML